MPAFFARTLEEFLAFADAKAPDPASGQPDLEKLKAFMAAHTNGGRVLQLLQHQPAVVSFAQVSYRPLHTYYFVNAAGAGRWARYHWEPEAGVAGQPLEELEKQPYAYLYEELERLHRGPVAFRLELELAQEGDPVDDPSAMWPDGRARVVGRLELVRPITGEETGDPRMMHDPTAVTDGIEVSPDDQIIADAEARISCQSRSAPADGSGEENSQPLPRTMRRSLLSPRGHQHRPPGEGVHMSTDAPDSDIYARAVPRRAHRLRAGRCSRAWGNLTALWRKVCDPQDECRCATAAARFDPVPSLPCSRPISGSATTTMD
jgi:Catalase